MLAAVTRPAEHRVIWDVGAGSGGFSVELALQNPLARVVAFERDPRSCRVLDAERGRLRRPRGSGARRGAGDVRRPGRRTGTRSGGRGRLRRPAGGRARARPPRAWRPAAGWWSPRSHWPRPGWRRGCWARAPWTGYGALQLSSARSGAAGIMQGMNPITIVWADLGPGVDDGRRERRRSTPRGDRRRPRRAEAYVNAAPALGHALRARPGAGRSGTGDRAGGRAAARGAGRGLPGGRRRRRRPGVSDRRSLPGRPR